MRKFRLGTIFSGIGAIEQALIRLGIDYDIEFACDNGDILIDVDTDAEMEKIKLLNDFREKNQYVKDLYEAHSRKTNFVKPSYLANYPIEEDRFFYDVKMFDGTDFKGKVDLFVGGSPCQSFSIAGARGGFEDTRGTLFYEYARLVKEIEPKIFIYENVFGVLNHDKGRTWETMQNVFEDLGYFYKWNVLDAKNYGIPQGRRRIFVVGFKNKEECDRFEFPKPVELKYTMHDFILDNCAEGNFISENGNIKLLPGGQEPPEKCFLSQKLIDYVMSPGTKNFYHENDTKIDLPIARAILSTQGNTHRASVNNYVTSNGKIRALDPRESLRLMGFPDTFKIVVSKAQSYKQSGNSIVVDVLIAIVREIQKVHPFNGINEINETISKESKMLKFKADRDCTLERVKPEKIKYKTVSLFAGIGGFDLGFEYAGFNVVWANDFDKYACETYRANVGNNIVCGDIRVEKETIPEHDVLVGGFPCQPFSTFGKLQGFEDEQGRGTMFFEIKEILKKHSTKVVVLENVKNIMHHDEGKTFKRIIHELNELGYSCYYQVLNSADYGIPQRRNRCYIIGFLREYFNEVAFEFPEKQELLVTTQDILDENVEAKYFCSKKIIGTILGEGTKNYIVKPTIDQPISKTLTATMAKMHRASQDNYITDQVNYDRHCDDTKTNIRKLTPNECRKLQGFPRDWKQVVSDCQAYKQFGNAVTVNVVYEVAKKVFEYIEKNKKYDW